MAKLPVLTATVDTMAVASSAAGEDEEGWPRRCAARTAPLMAQHEVALHQAPTGLRRRTMRMSTGAPMSAVMMPTWSSAGRMTRRPSVSAASTRMPPAMTQ